MVTWNANGLMTKVQDLSYFMRKHHLDVVLVNETHLKPSDNPRIYHYNFYRWDRKGRGGGTGIYIRSSIDHFEVTTPVLDCLDANTVVVRTAVGSLRLTSVYKSPSKKLVTSDLKKLFEQGVPTILAGDFNCKHQSWNSKVANTDGRILRDYLDKTGVYAYGPVEPTHYHLARDTSDVLDICLANNLSASLEVETVNDLNSDHNPVFVYFDTNTVNTVNDDRRVTRWHLFSDKVEESLAPLGTIHTSEDLEREVKLFSETLNRTVQECTVALKPKASRCQLPDKLERLLEARRKARRQWQKHRDPASKAEMNRLARSVKEALEEQRNKEWDDLVESLNFEDYSVWKMVKALKRKPLSIPPIHGRNGVVFSPEDKSEAFADSLEDQCSPNFRFTDEDHIDLVNKEVRRYFRSLTLVESQVEFCSPGEVRDILSDLNPKKAPGPDGLANKALRLLGKKAIALLTGIFNSAMRLGHFPGNWKLADVVVLPKCAENRHFPQNYRPISLLSTIGKVFERVVLRRLQGAADISGAIPDEQHGFRAHHGTCHQLLRVVEYTTYGFNWNMSTGALLLDVSKAFDRVWHKGLLYKLIQLNFPAHLVLLVRSFLADRFLQVKIGSIRSSRRAITAGVPQGSILSPLLYILFTHDMPKTPGTLLCQYADDTAVLYRAKQSHHISCKLQQAADDLEEYFTKWRIAVNGEKSTVLFMSRHTGIMGQPINIFGQDVSWTKCAKYLGVMLDKRLNWTAHVRYVYDKMAKVGGALAPIMCGRSTLPASSKVRLYKQVMRPAITYAAPVWLYGLSDAGKRRLQQIQNRHLRRALNAPWYVRNTLIHRDTNTPLLMEYCSTLASKFLIEATAHSNRSISGLLEYDPEVEALRHPRPKTILAKSP